MKRQPEAGSNNVAHSRSAASVRNLRAQIDKLDVQIVKLINDRAGLASEIGKLKSDEGSAVFSPAREEEVLENVVACNNGPLENNTLRAVFREIMSGSRAL